MISFSNLSLTLIHERELAMGKDSSLWPEILSLAFDEVHSPVISNEMNLTEAVERGALVMEARPHSRYPSVQPQENSTTKCGTNIQEVCEKITQLSKYYVKSGCIFNFECSLKSDSQFSLVTHLARAHLAGLLLRVSVGYFHIFTGKFLTKCIFLCFT